ncbi:guanine nucleotide-binding protein [Reticulomyxa filosa]|nr:guanine nucleotide-binding protein [Reticulomyxa filosa]|eukprot:ETO12292.1 guanine nucleotide-binding protein [Reticulomyxa filosa]
MSLKRSDEFGEILLQPKHIIKNENENLNENINAKKRNFEEMSQSDTSTNGQILSALFGPPQKRHNTNTNNDDDNDTTIVLSLPTQVEENILKSEEILNERMEKVMEDVLLDPTNRPIKTNEINNNMNIIDKQLMKYEGDKNKQIELLDITKGSLQLKTRKHYLQPEWHPPWKLYKVISGHTGWVGSIAVDPSNEWFCTGSADRTIKIWEFPTGVLKLTLTGHIAHVRGLAISARNPYLFSCGEDKKVCCWDLEQNKMIRSYHGHLSGVYSLALHPTIDVLITGGRDSTCRIWDIRTKMAIQVLTGHKSTIHSVAAQTHEPQVITGSHDHTVRCWDLKKFQTRTILTHHKKAIRSIVVHPLEYTFATGAADNIKVWKCPEAAFVRNMNETPGSIVEGLAVNRSNVLASVHQTGHIKFWDWRTGYLFHSDCPPPQPGSLDSESGIAACAFDITGSRLIACGVDKTLKFYKEDITQTPETFPIQYKPNLNKRY